MSINNRTQIDDGTQKFRFALVAVTTLISFFVLSGLLFAAFSSIILNVLHIPADQFAKFSYLAETLVGVIMVILFFIFYRCIFHKDVQKDVQGENTRPGAKEFLMSIVSGFGVAGISFLWIMLVEKIPALSESLSSMDKANEDMGGAMGIMLTAVIIAPVLEELVFRGILFRSLEKIKPGWMPIIISSIVFGAYHMNFVQAIYATIMGIVAAIIYAKTRNLLFPIMVHLTNNLLSAIESIFSSDTGNTVINIITVVMIIPTIYVVYRILTHKKRVEYPS